MASQVFYRLASLVCCHLEKELALQWFPSVPDALVRLKIEESTIGELGGIQTRARQTPDQCSTDSIHGCLLGPQAAKIVPNSSQSYR